MKRCLQPPDEAEHDTDETGAHTSNLSVGAGTGLGGGCAGSGTTGSTASRSGGHAATLAVPLAEPDLEDPPAVMDEETWALKT